MNPTDLPACAADATEVDMLQPLLQRATLHVEPGAPESGSRGLIAGAVVGELLALVGESSAALVRYDAAGGSCAVRARATVDLHGAHVGRQVVLMFERGDPAHPIVIGVVRGAEGWPADAKPAQVTVDADGERLLVSASEQLVLRCGKASITLTKAGKVLIEGSYLLTRSAGVNRIKGGSVQIN